MLSSAISTTSYLQSFWISSVIFHILGVLVCGGGFIIRYWLNVLQLEYWLNIIGIFVSFGRLIWISIQLPASIQPDDGFKWAWISIMIYTVGLGFVKGSIIVTYFRFQNNFILQFVAGAILVYTIGIVMAIAIIVSNAEPVDTTAFVVVHTALQVVFNATLACLPSKKIRHLGISRKQKIPLILVLFFGFLTIIATILGGFYRLAALTGFESSSNWARAELAASIEISVGVACSSFFAWKQLWNRWFKRCDTTQNTFSTGEPGRKKDEQSSVEVGKVESTEDAPNAEQSYKDT